MPDTKNKKTRAEWSGQKENFMFYVAYGSNLNHDQMAHRCPGAVFVGAGAINDCELVFKGRSGRCGHASIDPCVGKSVPVGVWLITQSHERALDRYEGFPSYYRKEVLLVNFTDSNAAARQEQCIIYIMNSDLFRSPSDFYLEEIRRGYVSCGLDCRLLDLALTASEERCGLS